MRRIGTIWGTTLVLAFAMFALLIAGKANAQTGENSDQIPELSLDWTVRVGVYVAQSKSTRNATGEAGFSGIVERRVYVGKGYDVNLGIGFNGINEVYSIPLMANIVAYRNNVRYGAGFGYAFGKRLDGRGTSGTAFDLLLGYQLTRGRNPLSVDLRYFFIGGSSNELDGYSLSLGLRF